MHFTIFELIPKGRHLPAQAKLTVDDPVVKLLIRMVGGVLAPIQGRRIEVVSMAFGLHTVARRAGPEVDLTPHFRIFGSRPLQYRG